MAMMSMALLKTFFTVCVLSIKKCTALEESIIKTATMLKKNFLWSATALHKKGKADEHKH